MISRWFFMNIFNINMLRVKWFLGMVNEWLRFFLSCIEKYFINIDFYKSNCCFNEIMC